MDISELLLFVHKEGASDLHISAGEQPMVRIHGDMRRIEVPASKQGRTPCHAL